MKKALPRIIPRTDHNISRTWLSPNALKVLYRLRDNGFIAYLVGGCVRDLLLGREPKDFDVATDATPNQVKRIFRNCRLIGRRFRLAHLHFKDEIIEVATFRSLQADEPEPEQAPPDGDDAPLPDSRRHLKSAEGMVLRDNVFGTPAEDALRRDFTVNALAYNIADFSIIDYLGGMEDLEKGLIRTIGDPRVRFTEDPVRMLRAVRFAAMLGFEIEAESYRAILGQADTITRAAPPRLYEEILKLFLLGQGERTYQLLRQTGIFAPLFPAFSAWLGEETGGFPHVGISQALDWIDSRVGAGEKVSPQLLIALMFGEYLQEKVDRLREEGLPPQQAVDRAVAEFLGETAPTVFIPHRIGVMVRDILVGQYRLRKIPGRKPEIVIARPGFADLLACLRFRAEVRGEEPKILAWWVACVAKNPLPPPGEAREENGPRPRRRSRRRRRRPAGPPA